MATIFSFFRRSEGLEEIIFKDRNKEYGSYALRKQQNSSVNLSSLLTFGIALIICILLLQQGKHSGIKNKPESNTVEAAFGIIPIIEQPIFIPPQLPDYAPHVRRTDFYDFKIVDEAKNQNDQTNLVPDIQPDIQDEFPPSGIGPDRSDPVPIEENKWVLFVAEMPTFNNGDLVEFSKWVQQNVVYPQPAIDKDIEGRVTAEFIIGLKGQIEDIKIMRGVDSLLDNEAIRVLKLSPLWKAGRQNGDPVRVKLILPIIFQLSK